MSNPFADDIPTRTDPELPPLEQPRTSYKIRNVALIALRSADESVLNEFDSWRARHGIAPIHGTTRRARVDGRHHFEGLFEQPEAEACARWLDELVRR